jgi:sugar phosphate isomerase/epimerase
MVAAAGFKGMAIDLGASDVATAHAVRPHLEAHGLTPLFVAFPRTIESLRETLIMAKDFGAPFVDVIGQVMPVTVAEMIPVIREWIDMADQIGMPIQFETHRNCITNDLYATLQLIDAIPQMRLCADLSHYVVDREFKLPLESREAGHIARILHRSDSFQGRVASRQQIQLQLAFAQHEKWVELFRGWWRDGLGDWRARNAAGSCIFLTELGPPEYAMTGPDGREMSNRWEESLTIKGWIEDIWSDLEREEAGATRERPMPGATS